MGRSKGGREGEDRGEGTVARKGNTGREGIGEDLWRLRGFRWAAGSDRGEAARKEKQARDSEAEGGGKFQGTEEGPLIGLRRWGTRDEFLLRGRRASRRER